MEESNMNLYEQLLKADQEKAREYATGTYRSKRLAKVLGKDEPVEIKIREVDIETIKNIQQYSTKRDGSLDRNKTFDSNLMLVVEGLVDPDLKNEELQKHFNASDAIELASVLFRFESAFIADEIIKLSNMQRTDVEDTVKN
jgi:hypothetical protein